MSEQDAPKIEFPCPNYPIKVIGRSSVDFRALVIGIVHQHVADFDEATVSEQDSSKGSFRSVRFSITATGEAQLSALHQALMATGQVKMVI
ncbi:MAG: YbeD family protein [Pontibacterium sp.]